MRVAVACDRHPLLSGALSVGVVDVDKVLALAETGTMPDHVRAVVIAALLPRAGTLTHRQLAEDVRRAEILADPEGADGRYQRARLDRSVRFDPADSAMAWITTHLPANDAVRVWATIDTAARAMRGIPGEERTLDQCRADAMVALTTGQLVLVGESSETVVMPTETMWTSAAGEPSSVGSAEDPASGVPCVPSGRVPSVRVPAVQVGVLVAATTLAGVDDLPGEIAGYGPVPADLAATMALAGDDSGDTTWRRLLTDPVSGVLTDWSTTAYRPGRILRAAVEARDRICTFVGCRQPAAVCEHDHLTPYDHQRPDRRAHGHGQTCAHSLHTLCKHHHQLKTAGVATPTRDARTGATIWTLNATGHTVIREPESLHPGPSARRLTSAVAGAGGAAVSAPDDPSSAADSPPF